MLLAFLSRHRLVRPIHGAQPRSFIRNISIPRREPPLILPPPRIRNQLAFLVLGSATLFTYAAWRTNLETDIWTTKLASASRWATVTTVDLRRAQQVELIQRMRQQFAAVKENLASVPALLRPWLATGYLALAQPYADASEGRRLCWMFCLLNAGIWVSWQIPRLRPVMIRSYMHNPLSGLSYTMLTAVFSHQKFIHLLLNCLALESFGSTASIYLGKAQAKEAPEQLESTPYYHFGAFFLTAGVFSTFVSHTINAKIKYPRLVARLASPASAPKVTDTWAAAVSSSSPAAAATQSSAARNISISLGASGAVYSCVTMTALAYPDSQVALVIPPSYPINIQWGVGGLMLLDTIGILRGWRLFDHYAHLGGAVFGVAYYAYGPTCWTGLRSVLAPQK